MSQLTPKKRVLFAHSLRLALLVVFGVFSLWTVTLHSPQLAQAATTSSTINFQARLETAAGAIAPDNTYNVEFKLYSGASCTPSTGTGCTAVWTEDYLNSASKGIRVANGYLSVSLGSITAFPSTINWDQPLWISMNIGGTTTGTPSWDGAMLPYLQLTAVPYAFRAGSLATTNTAGTFTSTLSIQAPSGGSQTFQIQDQGAAGTYNVLTAPTGSDGYIKLQGSTPVQQSGYFSISGKGLAANFAASSSISINSTNPNALAVNGITTSNGADTSAQVLIGTGGTANNGIVIQEVASQGAATFPLLVQNSAGNQIFSIDSSGSATVQGGTVKTFDQSNASTNSTAIILRSGNASGATSNSGSVTIDAGSATGTAGALNLGNTNASAVNIGRSGSTTTIAGALAVNGNTTLNGSTLVTGQSSVTALQVQDASSNNVFTTDTSGDQVVLGTAGILSGAIKLYSASATGSVTLNIANPGSNNYTLTIPTLTSNDTICTVGAANCGGGGSISLGAYSTTNTDAHGATLSAGVLTFQDASASAPGMVGVGNQTFAGNKTFQGFTIFQPAASMTNGQIDITQTATFANTTASGIIRGYQQNITVNSTTAATNKGFEINITDNSSATTHTNKGIEINLSGSNTSQQQYGIDVTASKGVAIRAVANGSGSISCANIGASRAIAVCADSTATSSGVGVYARNSSSNSTAFLTSGGNDFGAGVYALTTASTNSGQVTAGLKGVAVTSSVNGTALGVEGIAKSNAGTTVYGGYFTIDSANTATSGAALYATTSTYTAAASGNGINALSVLQAAGGTGQDVSAITGVTAGSGAAISLVSGNGGAATGASGANVGGAAGAVTIQAGNGGNVTSGTGTSGAGGNIVLSAGAAGTGGTSGAAGSVIIKNQSNSTTAFQVQNASGYNVLGADTSAGQAVLGTVSHVNGSIKFMSATGTGSISLNLSNGASSGNYTLSLPSGVTANDTICLQTVANCGGSGSGVTTVGAIDGGTYSGNGASISGSTIYLQAATGAHVGLVTTTNQTFGGDKIFSNTLTISNSSSASNAFAVASTPVSDASNSLIQIGAGILGGNSSVNGGTYIGLNAPSAGLGSAADLINLQVGGSTEFELDHYGNLTLSGSITPLSGELYVDGSITGLSLYGGSNYQFSVDGNGNILTSGTGTIKTTNSAAFVVQNAGGSTVLGVDTSASQVLFGKASTVNGSLLLYNSSNANTVTVKSGVTSSSYSITLPTAIGTAGQCLAVSTAGSGNEQLGYATCGGGGGGGGTQTITLVPEFTGATFSADGSNNTGYMSSDHVSGLASGQGYKHNFYEWSTDQATAQDYDIVTEYQLPTGFSNFTGSTWKMWVYGDNAGDVVSYTIKDAAEHSCATGSYTTATTGTWTQVTLSTTNLTTAPCSYAGNDIITVDFKLSSASSSATAYVKLGEVSFTYN